MKPAAGRVGHSLVELIVATTVGGAFLALLAGLLAAEARLARTTAEHVARQDALRVTWTVLSGELRYLDPLRDIGARAADSIVLRVVRGVLLPCEAPGVYRYRGLREPNSDKDSLVAVRTAVVLPVRLAATPAADACGAPGPDPLLRLQAPLPAVEAGEPLLLFEAGVYFLHTRALRYRLGAAGRQPLTGEWFDGAQSAFHAFDGGVPGVAGLRLVPRRVSTTHEAGAAEVTLRFWSHDGAAVAGGQ
jgi:hypothetical protein